MKKYRLFIEKMSTIVELKKSDIKGFWKNSKLYRETFLIRKQKKVTETESSTEEIKVEPTLMIDSKYLPVDISKLQKSPQLTSIVEICEYWGVDPFTGGIFSRVDKMTDEEIKSLDCEFLQDIFDIKKYFGYKELRDVSYDNVVTIPYEFVGRHINGSVCIKLKGEPVITKRFRELCELTAIAPKVKRIRRFLDPRQMETYFSRMWPNEEYDFEMSLVSIINEDTELFKHIWNNSPYNRKFRLQTSSSTDRPTFSMAYLANLYDNISLKMPDIEKMEQIAKMDENQSTPFSYDSFAAYMGKINMLQYLFWSGIKFTKFTLRYAKMQGNTICVDYIGKFGRF